MVRYLVDEDLPRSLARSLREEGIDTADVRDVGLRGCSDEEILEYAVQESRAVLTADVGFGNILRFALGEHCGILLARFPNEVSVSDLNAALLAAIRLLSEEEVRGNVVTITPTRIRVRRRSGP